MASMYFHYAVAEYGPYVAEQANKRVLGIKRVQDHPSPVPPHERQAELNQQFSPDSIQKIALEETE